MKKVYLVLVVLMLTKTGYAQETVFEFDISVKTIGYFEAFEQRLGSVRFPFNAVLIGDNDAAQPYLFLRKEREMPGLVVTYIFSKTDSVIKGIVYNWDIRDFDTTENKVQPVSFRNHLIEKYEELTAQISKTFENYDVEDRISDTSGINTMIGLNKRNTWMPLNKVTSNLLFRSPTSI